MKAKFRGIEFLTLWQTLEKYAPENPAIHTLMRKLQSVHDARDPYIAASFYKKAPNKMKDDEEAEVDLTEEEIKILRLVYYLVDRQTLRKRLLEIIGADTVAVIV